MSLAQVILLAVVQGLTEFLPISSTAHLILVPWAFGWRDQGLTFDVALHAGTLVAVLSYFARDWWRLVRDSSVALLNTLGPPPLAGAPPVPEGVEANSRLFWILVLATFPGALAGYFLEDFAGSAFRSPWLIAATTVGFAGVMWVADQRRSLARPLDSTRLADGLWVGFAQAIAILPGTSRSGITITAGLFRNLTRESAARFSFLLSTPIIAGAAAKKAVEVWEQGWPAGATTFDFLLGFAVSAVVGYAAIAFLIRYLQSRTLKIFVAYRLVLGVIIVAVELLRSSP